MSLAGLLEDLLPWIAAFYLLDSLVWVRSGQWLFWAPRGGAFRVAGPGLHLAGLHPMAEAYLVDEWPLALSSQAALPVGRHRISLDGGGAVTVEGRQVRIGPALLFEAASEPMAHSVASALARSSNCAPAARSSVVREILARRDAPPPPGLRGRRLRRLRVASLLFAVGLVALPFTFSLATTAPSWWGAGLVIGYLLVTALTERWLSGLGWTRRQRGRGLLPLLFFPFAAAHAAQAAGREALATTSPLRAALELLPPEGIHAFGHRYLHGLRESLTEAAGGEWEEFWRLRDALATRLLEETGHSVAELVAPRGSTDSSARCYCPCCATEYRLVRERCDDCGVSLLPVAGRD